MDEIKVTPYNFFIVRKNQENLNYKVNEYTPSGVFVRTVQANLTRKEADKLAHMFSYVAKTLNQKYPIGVLENDD